MSLRLFPANPARRASGTGGRPGLRPLRRRTQRGLSLLGLLLVAAVIIVVAIVTLRVVPSVLEYMAIRSAVEKVADSGADTAPQLQQAFDRQAAVDDISSISGRDLIIEKVGGRTVVSFAYQKRIRLGGPVSLLIDYHGSSQN